MGRDSFLNTFRENYIVAERRGCIQINVGKRGAKKMNFSMLEKQLAETHTFIYCSQRRKLTDLNFCIYACCRYEKSGCQIPAYSDVEIEKLMGL
jgi:hypothetical protein